jgi:hypothetical protein
VNSTLKLRPSNGFFAGANGYLFMRSEEQVPFSSKVDRSASTVLDLFKSVSNTSGGGNESSGFAFLGGAVSYGPGGAGSGVGSEQGLGVYTVQTNCNMLSINDANGTVRGVNAMQFAEGRMFLTTYPNEPTSCGGNGRVFSDHVLGSQPLVRSEFLGAGLFGPTPPDSLSPGNRILPMTSVQARELNILGQQRISEGMAAEFATQLSTLAHRHEDTVNTYNSVLYMTLTVVNVVSSTAIAALADSAVGWHRLLLMVVEGIIVYTTLGVVAHVYRVFRRPITFRLDIRVVIDSLYEAAGFPNVVRFLAEAQFVAVGVAHHRPKFILASLIVATVCSVVVTVHLAARLVSIVRRRSELKEV